MKKILAVIIAVMFLPLHINAETDEAFLSAAEYITKTVSRPTVGSIGGEWAVVGLARSGLDISEDIYRSYLDNLLMYLRERDGILHDVKYTEYSRVTLALTALGVNPEDFCGVNLLLPLGDFEKVCAQGINGPIWALIALDSGGYELPSDTMAKSAAMRDMYIEEILENQLSDGGWSLGGNIPSEVDITAMALCALARYTDRTDVEKAAEQAVAALAGQQMRDGGFESGGDANSESCAQVLTALCALGISPEDERFMKNSHTVTENLLSFQNDDGGFAHLPNGETNLMATEQAFYALCALKRYQNGANRLYDMSDAKCIKYEPKKNNSLQIVRRADFEDISDCFAKEHITALYERGVINGRSETIFDPNASVTRIEAAALCARAIGIAESDNNVFYDISDENPLCGAVNAAYAAGIANGVGENIFVPNGRVTREQCAVFLAKTAAVKGFENNYTPENAADILCIFDDYRSAAVWAMPSLAFCTENKIISDKAQKVYPQRSATRAEFAVMLFNMLDKIGMMDGEL